MKINFLKTGYRNNEEFYKAFINNDMTEYIDETTIITVREVPSFPIYLAKATTSEKKALFIEMINTISDNFEDLSREVMFDGVFWHSYLCTEKREFLIESYPEILNSQKDFENIVTKKFDWENYIYKAVLAYYFVSEHKDENSSIKYYEWIADNLDLYNYIIKYEIFRNSTFLINFIDIVNETETSEKLKSKIKNRPELGNDVRYGRQVVYEFNKSYPVLMAPMLDKDTMKEYFLKFLNYYIESESVVKKKRKWSLFG